MLKDKPLGLSVIIITKNEQDRLPSCLGSVVDIADEIIVLDSGSDDDTVAIAKIYTDKVYVTDWPGFGPQKQRALERASYDWVLSIDADEALTPELADEIKTVLSSSPEEISFKMQWAVMLFGKRLDHGRSARYVERLFRRKDARFSQDLVHEKVLLPKGKTSNLRHRLLHYSNRDFRHLLDKTGLYASLGAEKRHHAGRYGGGLFVALLRAVWVFFQIYILRLGVLDGGHGFLMAMIYAQYTFNKYAGAWAMRESEKRTMVPINADKLMNILVFTSSDSSFNSLRPEAEIFIELAKRGHQITIITNEETEYGRRYVEQGIKVIDGTPKKKICRSSIELVKNELARRSYDILLATNSKSIPNAAFAAKGAKVKLVTYRGTTGGLYRHDPSAYLTHLHPRVNGVICVSDAVRQDVVKRVWKNKHNVVAIHKGHKLEWYDQPRGDLTEFGIGADDFTVICAVNARPSKGLGVMLEAANRLADISNLHLLLVGKNIDKAPYTEKIANNAMRDRIHLTGYRHDAPQLIAASNVLVQPSVSGEGLPRAMMEAMSSGVPPVITDTGGGKEVVEDEVTGYVVPVKDANAIADRVRKLYNDPELVAAMSQRCKEKINKDVSLEKTVDQFIEYFQRLVAQK